MKKAILLAAYGAGNPQGKMGLRHFEHLCRCRFPDWPVRWAFTSTLLRNRLALQRQKSDSVQKALLRLHFEKFSFVAIQPLQTISGREHGEVCQAASQAASETGLKCVVGAPLLSHPQDCEKVAAAILRHLPTQRQPQEDIIYMGHGARHPAVSLYADLGSALGKLDSHVHLGTMNGATLLEDILPRLTSSRVWLLPLLSIIGRHALNDMAGPASKSWLSRIEASGHIVQPVLKGMAEYESPAKIWLDNLGKAIEENRQPDAVVETPAMHI